MAEWTKAAVLKTVMAQAIVGSNPTPTAIRRGAGVVELDCLLSSYGVSHRGFESHPLRSYDKKPIPRRCVGTEIHCLSYDSSLTYNTRL